MKKNKLGTIHLYNLSMSNVKYYLIGLCLIIGSGLSAQNVQDEQTVSVLSLFGNPLFNVLIAIILLLLITIAVLSGVLKNVAEISKNDRKSFGGKALGVVSLLFLLTSGKSSFAQEFGKAVTTGYINLSDGLFYFLLIVIAFEILIIAVLIGCIKMFLKQKEYEEEKVTVTVKDQPSLLEKLNASVSVEDEQNIMLDHNYDGIHELDNDLPPWWKYGFYFSILVAVIYMINYHVIGTGDLQIAEYDKSVKIANEAKLENEKNGAENVTENNVKLITDKQQLAEAENTYKENCAVCHGKMGEGGVGPNLVDDYWLHGGSIKDIFATIKYGWPDKGMKSWQADLPPLKINEIASYIKMLRGTHPANPKAPQGDLFTEGASKAVTDSIKSDSTNTPTIKDSVKMVTK